MKPYVIVERNKVDDLEMNVADLVEQGYAPVGGVQIGTSYEHAYSGLKRRYYVQAMFKKPVKQSKPRKARNAYDAWFDDLWKAFPKPHTGNKSKTYQVCMARVKEGATLTDFWRGLEAYSAYIKATGRWIKLPETFFGPDKHYENDWSIPEEKPKPVNVPWEAGELEAWRIEQRLPEARPGEPVPQYRQRLIKLLEERR